MRRRSAWVSVAALCGRHARRKEQEVQSLELEGQGPIQDSEESGVARVWVTEAIREAITAGQANRESQNTESSPGV